MHIGDLYNLDQPPVETNIAKNSSVKDGSLSGEEASYGHELSSSDQGKKLETEDSQSNCSKGSSDLTPSDDHSNEEVSSSYKESTVSSNQTNSVSSVTSSSYSNHERPSSEDDTTNAILAQDYKDVFNKLFVPLKVNISKTSAVHGPPPWLSQAHFSEKIAKTYKVGQRKLKEVLKDDWKKMQHLTQPTTVKQQLLQLLSEVDQSSAATATSVASQHSAFMRGCPPMPHTSQTSQPNKSVPKHPQPQNSLSSYSTASPASSSMVVPSSSTFYPSMPGPSSSIMAPNMTTAAFLKQVDCTNSASSNISVLSTASMTLPPMTLTDKKNGNVCIKDQNQQKSAEEESIVGAVTKSSYCQSQSLTPLSSSGPSQTLHQTQMTSSSAQMSKVSLQQERPPQSLDSNANLTLGQNISPLNETSQGAVAFSSVRPPVCIPVPITKTADMFFQDWCQAIATGMTGQSVEDMIMNKIFVSNDNTLSSDLKQDSNIFCGLE